MKKRKIKIEPKFLVANDRKIYFVRDSSGLGTTFHLMFLDDEGNPVYLHLPFANLEYVRKAPQFAHTEFDREYFWNDDAELTLTLQSGFSLLNVGDTLEVEVPERSVKQRTIDDVMAMLAVYSKEIETIHGSFTAIKTSDLIKILGTVVNDV